MRASVLWSAYLYLYSLLYFSFLFFSYKSSLQETFYLAFQALNTVTIIKIV
jgi:hypothetical protein